MLIYWECKIKAEELCGAVGGVPLVKLLGNVGAIILCIGVALVLLVFTFGINMSEIINHFFENMQERKQEKLKNREEIREQKNEKASKKISERGKREEKEQIEEKTKDQMDNQIKINFGGRILDDQDEKRHFKKYDHSGENLEPLTKESKKNRKAKQETEPDVLENNLFKDVEEQKEEKKRAVLQLEHAMTVEDEHYEYPPVELLSKTSKKPLKGGAKALTDTATKLQKTLYSFGVSAKVENVSVGPAITRYELKPAEGVRVSKIANLAHIGHLKLP